MDPHHTGQAVEYLRRSVERDKSADKDRGAGQRAANAAQAAIDGVVIARTFDGDWGTSGGRGKRERRAAMADLIDAIRAGGVSRVYCHTTDRLARDVEYGMALWNACKDRGTVIRAGTQTFDPGEPGYLTLWTVLLAQAEEDLDRMTRKNVDTFAYLRQHEATCDLPGRPHMGRCHLIACTDRTHCRFAHRHGHPFYGDLPGEDVNAVVTAYQDAGSVLGAARLLNARGIPTRLGGPWSNTTVRQTLVRQGAMPHRTRPGAKARGPFMFYGLLRCHCGHILTGSRYKNGSDPVYCSYKCHLARTVPGHGLAAVPEKRVLAWAMGEAELPDWQMQRDADTDREAQRAALVARRERVIEAAIDGMITREERTAKVAAIDEQLGGLAATAAALVTLPDAIDWEHDDPAAINGVLRALWRSVQVDEQMRSFEADWIVPQWRSA